ncbi:MAG: SDR family oxidoreductase, partial [Myxococcales bacterium]|nr:SDR family oxidoreductase [Myxococcales bacterium]
MNDPKRYLVTGATGLIGKQLVARLIERGGHITALVRPASRARHQALL